MNTKKMFMLVLSVCIISGVVCYAVFFNVSKSQVEQNTIVEDTNEEQLNTSSEKEESASDNKEVSLTAATGAVEDASGEEEASILVSTKDKILHTTKMVYQYYYTEDKVMEEREDIPPDFLIGLSFSDMVAYYTEWQIVSFSKDCVIMRRIMPGKSIQEYVIGQQDGFLAVYYAKEQNGVSLHDVTDIPLQSLTHEEQVRINDGIYVQGDEELYKILEDYGS